MVFEKWLKNKIKYYQNIFNLNNWKIKIQECELEQDVIFQTRFTDEGYTKVFIEYGELSKKMLKTDIKDLEISAIHEISHILIRDFDIVGGGRFATPADYSEKKERLCDNLSVIIFDLINMPHSKGSYGSKVGRPKKKKAKKKK